MQPQPRHATDKSASKASRERAGAKHGPPSPYEGFGAMPIAGAWRPGRMGKIGEDRDPYTNELLVEIPLASVKDVDDAYRSAKRMQRQWASALPQERREVLSKAAKIFARRKDEIVDWLVREAGSTLIKANLEFELARQSIVEASSYPLHVEGRILPAGAPGKESRIYRLPIGVVGVISPWNFPLQLSMRSVAPALALGNAVVLKPATETPVSGGLLIAKIYEEAGLPAGVLSVIVGQGSDVGDAMVEHPIPRAISFTGSTTVGRRIGEKAGRAVKRVCLELGGNGPLVVLDDADLDRAVDAAIAGKFLHQGQICMAVNRIVVDASQYDAFLDRFVERVVSLKVGDPALEGTVIGPLINQKQLTHVQKLVADTIAEGARLLVRGQPKGLVMPPVVLADVTNDMPAAREEIFGPVAPVIRVEDEDEALRVANDTEYGLSAAVFTRDIERGVRFAERLESGMVHVNDSPVNDEPNTAFGGEKASGLGRFGGEWAIAEFTTDRWISVQHEPRKYWF